MQNVVKSKMTKGFTLVELLVVISIIAVLLSILMPSLNRARSQAKQITCLNLTKQFGTMVLLYTQDNDGKYLLGRWYNKGQFDKTNSWYSNLTPYFDSSKKSTDVWNLEDYDAMTKYNNIWLKKLQCPAERNVDTKTAMGQGLKKLTYAYMIGAHAQAYNQGFGLADWATGQSRSVAELKRASETLVFMDSRDTEYFYSTMYQRLYAAKYPDGMRQADWMFPERHPAGYLATFADGHSAPVDTKKIQDSEQKFINDWIWRAK